MTKDQKEKPLLTSQNLSVLGSESERDGVPISGIKIWQSPETTSVAATFQSDTPYPIRNIEIEAEFKPIEKHIFVRDLEIKAIQSSNNLSGQQKTFSNHCFHINKTGRPFAISCPDVYRFYLTNELQKKVADFLSLIEACALQNQKLIEQLKQQEKWSEALLRTLFYTDSLFHFSFMSYLGSSSQTREQTRGPKDEILEAIKEIDQEMQEKIESDIKLERNLILREHVPIDKQAQYLINFIQDKGSEELIRSLWIKRKRILFYLNRTASEDPKIKLQQLENEIELEKIQKNESKKMRVIRIVKPEVPSGQIADPFNVDSIDVSSKINTPNPNSNSSLSTAGSQQREEQFTKIRSKDLVEHERQKKEQEKKQKEVERQERIKKQEEERNNKEEEKQKQQVEERRSREREEKIKQEESKREQIKEQETAAIKEIKDKMINLENIPESSSLQLVKQSELRKRKKQDKQNLTQARQIRTRAREFKPKYLLKGAFTITVLGLIYFLRDQIFKAITNANSLDPTTKNNNRKSDHDKIHKSNLEVDEKINNNLYHAVSVGDFGKALNLIRSGANPNQVGKNGYTVLISAVKNNNLEITKALLAAGANPNQVDKEGNLALIVAANEGHLEITKALLEAKADPNHAGKNGFTALILAAKNGSTEIVEALLAAKADTRLVTRAGVSALNLASQNGHVKIVEALLEAKANPNHADKNGATSLIVSARNGHLEAVKALLKAGANTNQANNYDITALGISVQNNHIETVKALLAAKANPNQVNNKDGVTVLMFASQNGNLEITKALLAAKANPNQYDEEGITALIHAAQNGNLEITKALLEAKADPNQANKYGFTALIFACFGNNDENLEMLKALLAAESDPNLGDINGFTALIHATRNGNLETVKALLEAKADPNQADRNGYTAIIVAAQNGHLEITKALLLAKADPNQVDKEGFTALTYAYKNGHFKIVETLKAKVNPNKIKQEVPKSEITKAKAINIEPREKQNKTL